MWSVLRKRIIISGIESTYSVCRETKRYAGHSKWANIKHIKAQKDGERAVLFAKISRQMRVAIAVPEKVDTSVITTLREEGTAKPADNARLSRIIEGAKKKNMPLATINNILEKATKSAIKSQTSTIDIRGPGGCIIIVELVTDNIKGLKALLNGVIKKTRSTLSDQSVRHVFHHKGFIITEPKENLDSATEDAIAVGAEDVEEIYSDGERCLQFVCEARDLAKVANQLGSRDYKIYTTEDRYIPRIKAHLSDADIEKADFLCTKLEAFDEVVRIHDNIA